MFHRGLGHLVWMVVVGFALAAGAAARTEHVFIISIDGGAPGEIQKSHMPTLKRLAAEGASTWKAQTIMPPLTLPAHTSMLTGVGTNQHHITWNNWSPTNGFVRFPTVFTAAKSAGYATAMIVAKEKFRHLALPDAVDYFDFDQAHSSVVLKSDSGGADKKKEGNVFAETIASNAAHYILKQKPNLCFIHFTDPDSYGHEFGWGSSEQLRALADTDAGLAMLMGAIQAAGIASNSVVLISADHGGHGKGHSQATPLDMQIPWIAWGKGVKRHFNITAPVNTCDTAATVLWLLGVRPSASLEGQPVVSAFL